MKSRESWATALLKSDVQLMLGVISIWSSLSSPGRFSLLLLPSMDDRTMSNIAYSWGAKCPREGVDLEKDHEVAAGVNLLGSKRIRELLVNHMRQCEGLL